PHREKQRLQHQPGLAVERAERLVHQKNIRFDGKGAGERAARRTPTPRPSGRADQRTGRARGVMFALLPKADIEQASPDVCYGPITAVSRCSKGTRYWITSSAAARSPGGTVRPSDFAVDRLMTNSNFVDCA